MHKTRRVAVLAIVCFSAPALAQTTTWNYNIFGPPRALTKGMEVMVEHFKQASGGKFEIKLSYGSALGPEKQTPEAIKSGGYEGGQICVGYYPNKFPLLSAMELPFLVPSRTADQAKVYEAVMHHPLIEKEMAGRWDIKYFGPVFLPPYEFMGNKRIASVADMRGVKMRISGLNAKALQAFGAVPTMVTAPEGYTALERGTIDSFGFPYTYAFGAYKMYEVSKFVTDGMAMSGFLCFQGVSLTAWNKLPASLRAELPKAQALADQTLIEAYKEADEKWLPVFRSKVEIVPFPAAERAKLAAGANAIWEDWVKEQEADGRPGRAMLDFIKAEVAKYK
ncbi:MAG: TRAP transporter substrate-binding protein DctP [Burkholderiales bacterium]